MRRAIRVASMGFMLSSAACGGEGCARQEKPTGAAKSELLRTPLSLRGTSLAGAEFGVDAFGNGVLPGTPGVHYFYPDPTFSRGYRSAEYFLAKGMNTFRVPFRWERLQPRRFMPFDDMELSRLRTTVKNLTERGAHVVLDVHNYARYRRGVIGTEVPSVDFADLWRRLAVEFQGEQRVLFALMNEPHDMPTEQWVAAANAAIAAVRAVGALNVILVPGNGWSGAHSWSATFYGTANAEAMLEIVDPAFNVVFEVHQHLDWDSSGKSSICKSETVGAERMEGFTRWLRDHGRRGFLGELSGGPSDVCLKAIANLLRHLEQNADVYLGWTYWAAGPAWKGYFTSIEPRAGEDAPQMVTLSAHLSSRSVVRP
jgi:endoglucanase